MELAVDAAGCRFDANYLLRLCVLRKKAGFTLSPREIPSCRNRVNSLTSLAAIMKRLLAIMQRILLYAAIFWMHYGVAFRAVTRAG